MNIHFNDYCERFGADGLFSEPLNAISNAGFVIAAIFAINSCRKLALKSHIDIYALCLIMMLIGFGSAAWHLQPTDFSLMLDIIPITLFINLYLVSLLRRGFKLHWSYIAIIFIILQKMNYVANTAFSPTTLNGTMLYLPTWLMLIAISIYATKRKLVFSKELLFICGLWSISLLFRTVDFAVCAWLPFGTHFIWHSINAIVLYRSFKILPNPKSKL